MPGFNTLPAVGGGGGQANMTYVASIHMNTYNRSWAQGGTPGYYAVYSTNQENGYAYFVGATTTGAPLNRLSNITHSFTRIDIIAPVNDMVSLYKAKVKATTEFANAFANFSSFPSIIRSSGNFVLPNNALPLVNIVLAGGGGGGGGSYHTAPAAGGGGGGGVVKLTAYQAVGTTSVTIGGGGGNNGGGDNSHGTNGSSTYFGNVYAMPGGGGLRRDNAGFNSSWVTSNPGVITNTGGAGAHHANTAAPGFTQTASSGLGLSGSPQFFGGNKGGDSTPNDTNNHNRGGGGGGATSVGGNGAYASGGDGGTGHISDIVQGNAVFGAGGRSMSHNGGHGTNGWELQAGYTNNYSHGGHSGRNEAGSGGDSGVVVVRYYIP